MKEKAAQIVHIQKDQAPATIGNTQIQLLKDTIAKGASDDELAMFVQVCNRLQLDPFARQIFLVPRWDSGLRREVRQPQASVDGLRVVAERTGKYEGQTQAQWCGEDGVWRDVWLMRDPPWAARVGVYKSGHREPTMCVARYESYVQRKKDGEPNGMWQKMPDLMLAKCAESLALRKAFPQDLAGVYSVEEMGQAETEEPAAAGRHTTSRKQIAANGTDARVDRLSKYSKEIATATDHETLERIGNDIKVDPVLTQSDKKELATPWKMKQREITGNAGEQ